MTSKEFIKGLKEFEAAFPRTEWDIKLFFTPSQLEEQRRIIREIYIKKPKRK